MTDDLASIFGPYQILSRLGRGAMGVVYRALDTRSQHEIALKVMLPEFADDVTRARFMRECEAASHLRHRNIVTVLETGVQDECPFIAMELLRGVTLEQRLTQSEPVTCDLAVDIVIQLCEGLQHAHDRGVVHRDVKPANIWLSNNGGVKLLDFGLAKIAGSAFTRAGSVVGSVAYMSPEQLRGDDVDGRADQFAAGGILYELLTRRRAFDSDSVPGVMHRVLHDLPVPVDTLAMGIPQDVGDAVMRALLKDPAARFDKIADFGTELRLARYQLTQTPSMLLESAVGDGTVFSRLAPAPPAPAAAADIADRTWLHAPSPDVETPRPSPPRTQVTASPVPSIPVTVVPRTVKPSRTAIASAAAVVVGVAALLAAAYGAWGMWHRDLSSPVAVVAERAVADGPVTGGNDIETRRAPATAANRVSEFAEARPPNRPAVSQEDLQPRVQPVPEDPPASQSTLQSATIPIDGSRVAFPRPAAAVTLRASSPDTPTGTSVSAPSSESPRSAARPSAAETSPATPVDVHVVGAYPFEVSGCGTRSAAASTHDLQVRAPCTLRLVAPAYRLDTTRAIEASSGRVELAAPQLAHVTLRTKYEWCTVILGQHAVGAPPVELDLVAGSYTATVQCPDRNYSTGTFTIEPGRSIRRLDEILR